MGWEGAGTQDGLQVGGGEGGGEGASASAGAAPLPLGAAASSMSSLGVRMRGGTNGVMGLS